MNGGSLTKVRYALQIQMHKALILFILNHKCRIKHYELNLFICEYTIKSYPAVYGFIAQYVFLFQYSDVGPPLPLVIIQSLQYNERQFFDQSAICVTNSNAQSTYFIYFK